MGVSVSATINLLNVIHSPGWQHINATLASRCTLVQSDLTGAANNFSRIMLRPEQSTERFRQFMRHVLRTLDIFNPTFARPSSQANHKHKTWLQTVNFTLHLQPLLGYSIVCLH